VWVRRGNGRHPAPHVRRGVRGVPLPVQRLYHTDRDTLKEHLKCPVSSFVVTKFSYFKVFPMSRTK
jgi:hypothetical protein